MKNTKKNLFDYLSFFLLELFEFGDYLSSVFCGLFDFFARYFLFLPCAVMTVERDARPLFFRDLHADM
jgi:hypothetical protein